mgnify:CR=1 FL=1
MFQDVPDEVVIRFQVCIFDILNTAGIQLVVGVSQL